MFEYLRDPQEIYRRSFAAVRASTDLSGVAPDMESIALRLVHACAMPEIIGDLNYSDGAATIGRTALAAGAPILVDATMVAAGITHSHLKAKNQVICTLDAAGVGTAAKAAATTRSAAAIDLWRPHLDGAIVVFGNAPTALFRLLELLADGAPKPALILGFPVGFIGAAESKAALTQFNTGVPYITLLGRRGGSAMAAAAINALAGEP